MNINFSNITLLTQNVKERADNISQMFKAKSDELKGVASNLILSVQSLDDASVVLDPTVNMAIDFPVKIEGVLDLDYDEYFKTGLITASNLQTAILNESDEVQIHITNATEQIVETATISTDVAVQALTDAVSKQESMALMFQSLSLSEDASTFLTNLETLQSNSITKGSEGFSYLKAMVSNITTSDNLETIGSKLWSWISNGSAPMDENTGEDTDDLTIAIQNTDVYNGISPLASWIGSVNWVAGFNGVLNAGRIALTVIGKAMGALLGGLMAIGYRLWNKFDRMFVTPDAFVSLNSKATTPLLQESTPELVIYPTTSDDPFFRGGGSTPANARSNLIANAGGTDNMPTLGQIATDLKGKLYELALPGAYLYATGYTPSDVTATGDGLKFSMRYRMLSLPFGWFYNGVIYGYPVGHSVEEYPSLIADKINEIINYGFDGKVYDFSLVDGSYQEVQDLDDNGVMKVALQRGANLALAYINAYVINSGCELHSLGYATDNIQVSDFMLQTKTLLTKKPNSGVTSNTIAQMLNPFEEMLDSPNPKTKVTKYQDELGAYYRFEAVDGGSMNFKDCYEYVNTIPTATSNDYGAAWLAVITYFILSFKAKDVFISQRRISSFPDADIRLNTNTEVIAAINRFMIGAVIAIAAVVVGVVAAKVVMKFKTAYQTQQLNYWANMDTATPQDLVKYQKKSAKIAKLASAFGIDVEGGGLPESTGIIGAAINKITGSDSESDEPIESISDVVELIR